MKEITIKKMETKDKYTFENIDKFEEEISRIIYMWRRYAGTRVLEGKQFSSSEFVDLTERIEKYLDNPDCFKWDKGKVEHCDFCGILMARDEDVCGACNPEVSLD